MLNQDSQWSIKSEKHTTMDQLSENDSELNYVQKSVTS